MDPQGIFPAQVKSAFKTFLSCENGATAIEYGLIAATIGISLIGAMPAFSAASNSVYQQILGYFDTVV